MRHVVAQRIRPVEDQLARAHLNFFSVLDGRKSPIQRDRVRLQKLLPLVEVAKAAEEEEEEDLIVEARDGADDGMQQRRRVSRHVVQWVCERVEGRLRRDLCSLFRLR